MTQDEYIASLLDREMAALQRVLRAEQLLRRCDAITFPVNRDEAVEWYAARDAFLGPVGQCGRRCRYQHPGSDYCAGTCQMAPGHDDEDPHDCLERP